MKDFIILIMSYILLLYGIASYLTDGITTGNYGLIAIPFGLGFAIPYTINFISKGDANCVEDEK